MIQKALTRRIIDARFDVRATEHCARILTPDFFYRIGHKRTSDEAAAGEPHGDVSVYEPGSFRWRWEEARDQPARLEQFWH